MVDLVENNIIAIIPARGGSKRIPRKNILPVGGKPMIGWTIEAASKSRYISKVIVSTDDYEIASEAKKFGAEVPFLRDESFDDHAPVSLATLRTLIQLENSGQEQPEFVVQLMANCPLRGVEEIDAAVSNFFSNKPKFQISCSSYGWMNPWWAHKLGADGTAIPIFTNGEAAKRSQDLSHLYCPTGAIWIAEVEALKREGSFYGAGYSFFPMHWSKAIDIDGYEDLEMAERLLNSYRHED